MKSAAILCLFATGVARADDAAAAAAAAEEDAPEPFTVPDTAGAAFVETFQTDPFDGRWVESTDAAYDGQSWGWGPPKDAAGKYEADTVSPPHFIRGDSFSLPCPPSLPTTRRHAIPATVAAARPVRRCVAPFRPTCAPQPPPLATPRGRGAPTQLPLSPNPRDCLALPVLDPGSSVVFIPGLQR